MKIFDIIFWLIVAYVILALLFGWWPFTGWPM